MPWTARVLTIVLFLTVHLDLSLATVAQETTPAGAPLTMASGALDLAAMAPVAEELPPGFVRLYGGNYAPGSFYGTIYRTDISPEGLQAAGLQRTYEDSYTSFDAPISIGIFFDEYATPAGAEQGFAIFEGLSQASPDATVLSSVTLPTPNVGDEPALATAIVARYPDGIIGESVNATFRLGNLIIGVWEERYTVRDDSGTPVATPTLGVADPQMVQDIADLSATLVARAEAVLAGVVPPGIDPMLERQMLPLQNAPGAASSQSWEGYRDGRVVLGYDGSLSKMADTVLAGYGRTVALTPAPDYPPPYLAVTLSDFTSPEAAEAALEAVRATPADLPTPGPFARGTARDLVADPEIPGADAALAFGSALDQENPDTPTDSARVVFVSGSQMAAVDVQGASSAEAALASAVDLAAQQAACLAADAPCRMLNLPVALAAPMAATPAA
jgi:hypothetical protein